MSSSTMNMKTNLRHLAIIPDGNRRWARKAGLPSFEGHRRGFNRAMELVRKTREMGIQTLTLWAFSTENWQRTKQEVGGLMRLFSMMIDNYLKDAFKDRVRITHLGRKDRINERLRKKIAEAEEKTKEFTRYYLNIALDYGGQDEIVRATNRIISLTDRPEKITRALFNQSLDTRTLPYPSPDLIIRTGGEMRMSGFMIWQAAYSEYLFINKYFPDFTPVDLEKMVELYLARDRRFGK